MSGVPSAVLLVALIFARYMLKHSVLANMKWASEETMKKTKKVEQQQKKKKDNTRSRARFRLWFTPACLLLYLYLFVFG